MVYDDTFTTEFYESLKKQRLMLKMHLAAGLNGGRKSNSKGSSVEFSDFREYILGDDIRRIDWNAYGRFDKFFVKLFMEEREGIFRVFVDASESMTFGTPLKSVVAKRQAGLYAYSILDNSDRLILYEKYARNMLSHTEYAGKQGFSKAIDALSRTDFSGDFDLFSAIRHQEIKSRGVSIIISDFYTHDLEETLKYLTAKKQEIILIQTLSKEEENPEILDSVRLLDSEILNPSMKDGLRATGSHQLKKNYKKQYDSFIRNIEAVARHYNAKYIRLIDGIPQ